MFLRKSFFGRFCRRIRIYRRLYLTFLVRLLSSVPVYIWPFHDNLRLCISHSNFYSNRLRHDFLLLEYLKAHVFYLQLSDIFLSIFFTRVCQKIGISPRFSLAYIVCLKIIDRTKRRHLPSYFLHININMDFTIDISFFLSILISQ